MVASCKHRVCSKDENIWFPTAFQNRTDYERHPWCVECGDIKNISEDQPKPIGYWMNLLGRIGFLLDMTQCQKRLIAQDMLSCEYLCDTFGTFGSAQQDLFFSIVRKHCANTFNDLDPELF